MAHQFERKSCCAIYNHVHVFESNPVTDGIHSDVVGHLTVRDQEFRGLTIRQVQRFIGNVVL